MKDSIIILGSEDNSVAKVMGLGNLGEMDGAPDVSILVKKPQPPQPFWLPQKSQNDDIGATYVIQSVPQPPKVEQSPPSSGVGYQPFGSPASSNGNVDQNLIEANAYWDEQNQARPLTPNYEEKQVEAKENKAGEVIEVESEEKTEVLPEKYAYQSYEDEDYLV